MELEWQKVSAVHDCPPGYWTFCSENLFLEPAADASDVNSIREGGSGVGTEPQPLKASNVSPCTSRCFRISVGKNGRWANAVDSLHLVNEDEAAIKSLRAWDSNGTS